jgi:hypothetical protein
MADMRSKRGSTWIGIALMLITGAIHLYYVKAEYVEAPYLGVMFFGAFLCSIVATLGIFRGEVFWGWGLGGLIAIDSLAGYLLSRTVGLPISGIEPWGPALGYLSLIVEAVLTIQSILTRPWEQIPFLAARFAHD